MKLVQVGQKTYYIENDTKFGIYKTGENSVCVIDTGFEGEGEKIDEIISARGWSIECIINTHTHIDHVGGNEYLMKKYNIPAYCTDYEMAFAHFSQLETSYMNGGYPCENLRKVFKHPGMIGFHPIEECEIKGIEWMKLPGHSFDMIGIKTDDDVWFLGDSYLSRDYLKNRIYGYLYNVDGYLDTLHRLKHLQGKLFIPAHGIAETDINEILEINIDNVASIISHLKEICSEYTSLDHILQKMYEFMRLRNNTVNHALISSAMKSYLTYLQDRGEMECSFEDNIMVWKTK